jgi:hypothetical protein
MRLLAAVALGFLLCAAPLRAGTAKECTDLAARIDNDVSSPSGVRVSVTARNHCQEDVDGSEVAFKVKALGGGGNPIASQYGSFGSSIRPGATAETKVFVVCDPERVRSVTVEPQ